VAKLQIIKEKVVDYFKVLILHLPGKAKKASA
jgi:hypothetical protein